MLGSDKVELEKTNTEVVTVEAEDVEEESPLLVAQRYLNIFRQIHIFKDSKKAEFDNELLNLPEKIKRILVSLPGGSILLEHILEIEEQNNYSTKLTKSILSQKKGKDAYDSPAETNAQSLTPVSGEIKIGNDFAAVLAKSLAAAFGNSPLPQPIYSVPSVPAVNTDDADGAKVATQTNVAASTVNNIHVDYSIFQNLADAINKSNTQTHNDFMKVIETLSQNFSPTIIPADGVPISAITSSIAQILKETSRQQLEEMKLFSQSLTEAILGGNNYSKPTRSTSIQQEKTELAHNFNDFADKRTSFDTTPEPAPLKRTSFDTTPESKFAKDTSFDKKAETQTISVVNRTINPLTSQSTVQKNSYSIPADTVSQSTFSTPKPQKKVDPLKQAQSVLARTSLNVKPISLSLEEPENSFTQPKVEPKPETPPQQVETQLPEYENKSLNVLQDTPIEETYGNEEEWEYVDEYGNPITDATGDEEWEYVDENGNPITDEGDGEWEYVDETEQTTTSEINENTAEVPQPVVQVTENNKVEETPAPTPVENKPSDIKETKTEPDQKEKPTKAGGIFSSLFKKKSQTGEEAKASAEQKQEEEKTSADDVLAAAFSDKPAETSKDSENKIKKSSVDNLLMAAFSGKSAEAPKEEPQKQETKDSADDILAAAFGGNKTEVPNENSKPKIGGILAEAYKEIEKEKKAISSKDMLAQLAKSKPQTTEELLNTAAPKKNNSADDILAAAFGGNKNENSEEKPKPKMGGILAEAYKEIEISKKPLSSKDMLAEAFKSKPQTSAELLNSKASVEELTEDTKASADDILVAAFGGKPAETPKEEPQEQEAKDSANDILAAAFGGKPAETPKEEPQEQEAKDSADDILAAAFGGKPAETPKEEPQEQGAKDSADDILAAAFGGKPAETPKEEPQKEDKPATDNILMAAFEKPKENKKYDPEFEALLKAFQS